MPGVVEFTAVVTDIREERRIAGKQRWQIALDQTEFAADTGRDTGSLEVVARSGAKLQIEVLGVVEADGEIWHVVEKPLGVGAEVRGRAGFETQ